MARAHERSPEERRREPSGVRARANAPARKRNTKKRPAALSIRSGAAKMYMYSRVLQEDIRRHIDNARTSWSKR